MSAARIPDIDAAAVLEAEHELEVIVILLGVMPLTDIAAERLADAIDAVARGLQVQRSVVGLQPSNCPDVGTIESEAA